MTINLYEGSMLNESDLRGLYKLRLEFDDWDIDFLPSVRWFNVG